MINRRRYVRPAVLVGLVWACLSAGPALAGVVPPTDPATLRLNVGATVSLSLYQLDSALPTTLTVTSPSRCTTTGTTFYKDVTDCWLPEWNPTTGGKSVFVVVNGSTNIPVLVPPVAGTLFPLAAGVVNPFVANLTTSAYPGRCTNSGAGTAPSFTLSAVARTLATSATTSVTGYELVPADCGGMAVIQVGSDKFIVPRDGTGSVAANGLPEAWEALFGGVLDPSADIDVGPVAGSVCCDGISTFDEYRGFIVSGKQIRTDPTQKNLFLHLVNPQPAGAVSYFGGGTTTYPAPTSPNATLTVGTGGTFTTSVAVFSNATVGGEIVGTGGGRARIVAVTSATSAVGDVTQAFPTTSLAPGAWKLTESLMANVFAMLAPDRVHLIGFVPGSANLLTNEWVDTFVSLTGTTTLNVTDTVNDRIINPNRIYGSAQKGMRVIESVSTDSPSVLGYAYGVGSPNQVGNIVIYSQNIVNYITNTLIGTATTLKYSTASMVNGVWTWSTPILAPDGDPATTTGDGVASNVDVRNFIISKAMQFYTGMEIGHSLDLVPTVQGTSKVSYGYHFAPGTGDCLDQAITTTAKSGAVTFNIPSVCGNADQSQFHVH